LLLLAASPLPAGAQAPVAPPGVLRNLAAEARDLAALCYEVPPATGAAAAARPWRGAAVEVPRLDALSRAFAADAQRAVAALAAIDPAAAERERLAPSATPTAPAGPAGRMLADPRSALRFRENPGYGAEFCAAQRIEIEDWAVGLARMAAGQAIPPAAAAPARPAVTVEPGPLVVVPQLIPQAVPVLLVPSFRADRRGRHPPLDRFHFVERPARPGRMVHGVHPTHAQPFHPRPRHHHGIVGAQPGRGGNQAGATLGPVPAFGGGGIPTFGGGGGRR
jgi:hypothetical protein